MFLVIRDDLLYALHPLNAASFLHFVVDALHFSPCTVHYACVQQHRQNEEQTRIASPVASQAVL